MSLLSKIVPTSASIQKEYIKKRQRQLFANDPAKTARVQAVIEKMMEENKYYHGGEDWHDAYLRIHH